MNSKFLYWRGNSLWCRVPRDGTVKPYALGLRAKTPAERRRCEEIAFNRQFAPAPKAFFEIPVKAEPYRPTIRELMSDYLNDRALRRKTPRRPENARNQAAIFVKEFGDIFADEMTEEKFAFWIGNLRNNGYAVATLRVFIHHAKKMFIYALRRSDPAKRLTVNPLVNYVAGLGPSYVRKKFIPKASYFDDYLPWVKIHDKDFYPFFFAQVITGQRPQELSFWRWEWMAQGLSSMGIVRKIMIPGDSIKNEFPFECLIPDALWSLLEEMGVKTSGLVFINPMSRKGEKEWRDSTWGRHFNKIIKAFPDDPHIQGAWFRDGRRSYITHKHVHEHVDIKVIQALVGHRRTESTLRYVSPQAEDLARVVYGNRNKAGKYTFTESDDKSGDSEENKAM